MKKSIALLSAIVLAIALPAAAQQRAAAPAAHSASTPRANQGKLPPPPPARTAAPAANPQAAPRPGGNIAATSRGDAERNTNGHTNDTQHVNHDTWYSRPAPNDPRFALAQPFAHGHFANVGTGYRYGITRIDATNHYFWLPSGGYFMVPVWDWAVFSDWCYDCGDDFVIYLDPDHIGWYLLYNSMTGAYIHIQYMGA